MIYRIVAKGEDYLELEAVAKQGPHDQERFILPSTTIHHIKIAAAPGR